MMMAIPADWVSRKYSFPLKMKAWIWIHRHSKRRTVSAFPTVLNQSELSILCWPGTARELGKPGSPVPSWMVMGLLSDEVYILYVTVPFNSAAWDCRQTSQSRLVAVLTPVDSNICNWLALYNTFLHTFTLGYLYFCSAYLFSFNVFPRPLLQAGISPNFVKTAI